MRAKFQTKVKGLTNITWLHIKDSVEEGYLYIDWEIDCELREYGVKGTIITINSVAGNVDLIDCDSLKIRNVDIHLDRDTLDDWDIELDIDGNWDHLYPTEIIIDYDKKDIEICFAR